MGLLRSRSRSQRRFKMSVNVCLDNIFWITKHFVTKVGMVMQHHEPESCGNVLLLLLFLQGQGHGEGSYDQNLTLSSILSELLIPWQPNLVWWYIIISQSATQKNWFIVFYVKVTVRAYIIKIWLFLLYLLNCWSVCNVDECFSGWYLLNHRTFCDQIWYGDAASWARVMWKILLLLLLLSRSRSQWGLI